MPDPYKQQSHDKLWTLLEAYAPVTSVVKAGNRVRMDGEPGWLKKFFARAPNDFPRIEITNGRFTHSGYTEGVTYATENAVSDLAGVADSIIRRRCEFRITITARDEQTDVLDAVEEAVQVALLKGGPQLGLTFVVPPWGPLEATQAPANVGGVSRQQSIITIPVLMEFLSGALIA